MQRELVELKEVRDAALEVAEAMDIPVRDGDEPLTLAGRLQMKKKVKELKMGLDAQKSFA